MRKVPLKLYICNCYLNGIADEILLSRYWRTTFLSCLSSLFVNSETISRNAMLGGGPVGSLGFSMGVTEKRIPSRWSCVTASRFFRASRPKESANLGRRRRIITHGSFLLCYVQLLPFGQFFERVELDRLPVDLGLLLQLVELFELEDESVDHGLGAVHLVVLASLAQSCLYNIAWNKKYLVIWTYYTS